METPDGWPSGTLLSRISNNSIVWRALGYSNLVCRTVGKNTMRRRSPSKGSATDPTGSELETDPLLISAKEAARICGKSLRTWQAWDSAGWIPQPVRISRSTLWSLRELEAWVTAGCPRRNEWEARK